MCLCDYMYGKKGGKRQKIWRGKCKMGEKWRGGEVRGNKRGERMNVRRKEEKEGKREENEPI